MSDPVFQSSPSMNRNGPDAVASAETELEPDSAGLSPAWQIPGITDKSRTNSKHFEKFISASSLHYRTEVSTGVTKALGQRVRRVQHKEMLPALPERDSIRRMNAKRLASAATLFGAGLLTGWLVIPQPAPKAAGHDRKIPELVAKDKAAEKEPPAPSLGMNSPADLARALSDPVSSHRRAALYRTLSELTPDNWQPLYDAFMERRKQGRHDQGDWELFLNALGAVDGQRAMTRLVRDMGNLKSSPPPDFHYILRTWVPANQAEALAWHESLPKGPFRDGLWSGYLGGLAEVDLDAAIKGVEAVDAQYRGYFLFDLAPRVFQNGGLAAGNAWLLTVIQCNENSTPEAQ